MAELTPLDEKLGEVLGLAQATQKATTHVAQMEDGDRFRDQLDRMLDEAEETERRTDALIDSLEGRKTAIRELARETKSEAEEMLETYLGDEEEALDGFEFLMMAEAGELGHWEIVRTMGKATGEDEVVRLADWAVEIQRKHFDGVRGEQPRAGRGRGPRRLAPQAAWQGAHGFPQRTDELAPSLTLPAPLDRVHALGRAQDRPRGG